MTPTPIPFPRLVDSTIMAAFDACEVKALYEYGHHLSPLAISPDLHAGGAFAKGIEIVRRALYADKLPLSSALPQGLRAMIEFWGDFEPPLNHPKTLDAMMGALDDYFREYPPETDLYRPLILANGEPAVEFTFAIPTQVLHPETSEPIIYAGRADMLARYADTFCCVVDEKTTKSISYNWATLWAMRGQHLGYCFAGQYFGHDVSRALIRGIAILKTKYNHLEVLEEFPQWQIDRWWETTNKKIAKMVKCWEENDWTHSYGDACSSYGGCSFLELCTSKDPESSFSNFQRRVWNPLEKDPTWPDKGPEYEVVGNIKDMI